LSFFIIAYVFSSTKLEKRANKFCLEVGQGEVEGRGQGREMAMYTHMNKLMKQINKTPNV
jgi:hypothetical protein